jgi:glutathione S-transferase
MYTLYIANKNYSSWSLRAWGLMRELELPFKEQLMPFGETPSWRDYGKISSSGKVPCLVDGEYAVWDSLAIAEYLAEGHRAVWPADPMARAWARSAAAEMHSGFNELRNSCSMSCGVRVRLNHMPAALERDIARIGALWNDGVRRFGGPFLAGRPLMRSLLRLRSASKPTGSILILPARRTPRACCNLPPCANGMRARSRRSGEILPTMPR